jgi:thiol-disulfide isomerase/thioredoxin
MRVIVLGLLLCATTISAQALNPQTLKEQYAALLKEYELAETAWAKSLEKAPQDGKHNSSGTAPVWPGRAFVPRFLKLAEANPEDPAATEALLWVVNRAMNIGVGGKDFYPSYTKALELLTRGGRLDEKQLGQACTQGLLYTSAPTERFLRVLIDRSGNRVVRGQACLALAKNFAVKVAIAGHPRFNPKSNTPSDLDLIKNLDPEYLNYVRSIDRKASQVEAEALFEQAINEYGDIVNRPARSAADRAVTVADAARSNLHELRDLAIGKVAPEIAGEDIDGKSMKLSEYRGKVVALVFWATWCGPCMGLVPHERTMVERLKGKPFVLLGIDGDMDREQAKKAVTRERMTWRSWWNGGPTGQITTEYNVEGWPTVYVLDENGVIRHKQLIEKSLDEAVDALLAKMENSKR